MAKKEKTIESAETQAPQFDKWQQISLLLMIVSISGFIGWLWEYKKGGLEWD